MIRATSRLSKFITLLALALVVSLSAMDIADARRGGGFGGFGSRGARTFKAPAPTRTAPNNAAPIERSMTPNTAPKTGAAGSQATAGAKAPNAGAKSGFLGGFGGSMLGGLMMGGLIGMLLGQGLGGMAGMFGLIIQVLLIAGVAMLAMRFFANRQRPATQGATQGATQSRNPYASNNRSSANNAQSNDRNSFSTQNLKRDNFSTSAAHSQTATSNQAQNDAQAFGNINAVEEVPLAIAQEDLEHFETMLKEIQTAYGNEDYAGLRLLTTPEAMSYLAEELGETASKGLRNQVSDVELLQGDVSESWSEANRDYATVAMRYSSIDVMVDRNSGEVVEGDAETPSESTELWTFTRQDSVRVQDWKLAAIQGAD